jgi:F-type H+-transporting ATPase subunit 8
MPQFTPYYFLNQITFAFVVLLIVVYIFSKYILPLFTLQQVTRNYIKKLSNK